MTITKLAWRVRRMLCRLRGKPLTCETCGFWEGRTGKKCGLFVSDEVEELRCRRRDAQDDKVER